MRDAAGRVPSQCSVCHAWPSQRICNACVARFAQPAARCQRCALHVPAGVAICGTCLRSPPSFDACLAAVDYAFPWADMLADFKFRADPGLARTLSVVLRSTPWVEPALEAADRLIPVPLSDEELKEILADDDFDDSEEYGEIHSFVFSNPDPYAKVEPRPDDAPKREFTFDEKGNIVVKNPSAF